jgi:hypothetical protein
MCPWNIGVLLVDEVLLPLAVLHLVLLMQALGWTPGYAAVTAAAKPWPACSHQQH